MRYLRQLKTGHIYVHTDLLAKRRDMVPFDEKQARARIEALRSMIQKRSPTLSEVKNQAEDAAQVKAAAMELTDLENKVESMEEAEAKAIEDAALPEGKKLNDEEPVTAEEATAAQRQSILDQDPKYKKVCAFRSRNEVEQFMILEFGEEIDVSLPFKTLKDYALEKMSRRILEE